MAAFSFSFQCWATSLARGSSGFGDESKAWTERRTVRIWRAGDHLSVGDFRARAIKKKPLAGGFRTYNVRVWWCRKKDNIDMAGMSHMI